MRLQFRGWMTPAAVGVISFAAGTGVGYFFKKYQTSNETTTVQVDKNEIENLRAEVVDQDIRLEEVAVDVNGLQFRFDENLERMNSVVQQANYVIVKFMDGVKDAVNKTEAIQHIDTQPITNSTGKSKQTPKKVQAKVIPKEKVEESEGIFPVSEDEDWSYEEEVKNRNPERPYIIHRDEFFSNESDHRQTSLTYYQGDNILCDEQDVPVYNPERIVGELKFGHGSADPSIVYIRNDKLEAEYEVILDEGYYQTQVLGHEVEDAAERNELKHGIQRFRASD